MLSWSVAGALGSWVPPDLIGFGVSLFSMVIVTLLTQKVDPPRPLTDCDGNPMELRERLGTLRGASAPRDV